MKIILVSIAVILVALGIYTYSNQEGEKSISVSSIPEKKEEVKKTKKVSVVAQEVKEKKSSTKNITVKSPKVISQEVTQEVENEEEIGEGITLESIENADVSDDEKKMMRDDMAYYQGLDMNPQPVLSDEEILKIIDEDLKNGFIK